MRNNRAKAIFRSSLQLFLCTLPLLGLRAADSLELTLKAVDGTGDPAMFVAWIETTDGAFVRTLTMFSKDKKYFQDLSVWWKPHAEKEGAAVPDAMISPTIKWSMQRTVSVPLKLADGKHLLSGSYVLRLEQRKDKGGHYKKLRIPLTADFTQKILENEGYLKNFSLRIKKD
jgi:hypothetical protein